MKVPIELKWYLQQYLRTSECELECPMHAAAMCASIAIHSTRLLLSPEHVALNFRRNSSELSYCIVF